MSTLTKILYTAAATATGDGREGHVQTDDKVLDIDLERPGQGSGTATNPEQLFAAGYAACFHSALKGSARRLGYDVIDSAVTAEVMIGPIPDESFGLAVALHVEIGGLSLDEAQRIAQDAHRVCPYSNATRGNIDVTVEVEVG